MEPTGRIGLDESILHSCHFDFGNRGGCGAHLDMVVSSPTICRQLYYKTYTMEEVSL